RYAFRRGREAIDSASASSSSATIRMMFGLFGRAGGISGPACPATCPPAVDAAPGAASQEGTRPARVSAAPAPSRPSAEAQRRSAARRLTEVLPCRSIQQSLRTVSLAQACHEQRLRRRPPAPLEG